MLFIIKSLKFITSFVSLTIEAALADSTAEVLAFTPLLVCFAAVDNNNKNNNNILNLLYYMYCKSFHKKKNMTLKLY